MANWIARRAWSTIPRAGLPNWSFEPRPARPAVFYIHPTTYLERDRWNAPLDDRESRDRAALFVQPGERLQRGRRDLGATLSPGGVRGVPARQQGCDAGARPRLFGRARAFDAFVAAHSAGRPIILAGHSQGALHLSRLLREKRSPASRLARRIVAAYVVGWPLSTRRHSGDGPARLPRRRRVRLHPVVAELRRSGQTKTRPRRL